MTKVKVDMLIISLTVTKDCIHTRDNNQQQTVLTTEGGAAPDGNDVPDWFTPAVPSSSMIILNQFIVISKIIKSSYL